MPAVGRPCRTRAPVFPAVCHQLTLPVCRTSSSGGNDTRATPSLRASSQAPSTCSSPSRPQTSSVRWMAGAPPMIENSWSLVSANRCSASDDADPARVDEASARACRGRHGRSRRRAARAAGARACRLSRGRARRPGRRGPRRARDARRLQTADRRPSLRMNMGGTVTSCRTPPRGELNRRYAPSAGAVGRRRGAVAGIVATARLEDEDLDGDVGVDVMVAEKGEHLAAGDLFDGRRRGRASSCAGSGGACR